jgi:beta-lactamase regulating signal transducer with metallopeptidase domain
MTEVTRAFWIVVEAALRGTPVLLAAWAVCVGLRRQAAAVRHAVWALALSGMLVVLVLSAVGPRWEISGLPAMGQSIGDVSWGKESPESSGWGAAAPLNVGSRAARTSVPAPASVAAVIWLCIAAVLLLRIIVGHLLNHRLGTASSEADAAWSASLRELERYRPRFRRVGVVACSGIEAPQTWGILAPVIAVPKHSGIWPADLRRSILLHELAHIRRLDSLHLLVGALAVSVFWFHPGVWRALRGVREEMESACDDAVLRDGVAASRYAAVLVDLTRRMHPRTGALALVQSSAGDVERRVRRVLDPARSRSRAGWRALLTLGGTGLSLCLALGAAGAVPGVRAGPVITGPASFRWVDRVQDDVRVLDVTLRGRFALSDDTAALVGAEPGSRLRIEERDPDGNVLRVAVAVRTGGMAVPEWTWNTGQPAQQGEWLAGVLPQLVRVGRVYAEPAAIAAVAPVRRTDQNLGSFSAVLRGIVTPALHSVATASPGALDGAMARTAAVLWRNLELEVDFGDRRVHVSSTEGSFEDVLPDIMLRELSAEGVSAASIGEGRGALVEAGRRLARAWEERLMEGS